jgi:hypothetical protein
MRSGRGIVPHFSLTHLVSECAWPTIFAQDRPHASGDEISSFTCCTLHGGRHLERDTLLTFLAVSRCSHAPFLAAFKHMDGQFKYKTIELSIVAYEILTKLTP